MIQMPLTKALRDCTEWRPSSGCLAARSLKLRTSAGAKAGQGGACAGSSGRHSPGVLGCGAMLGPLGHWFSV